MESENSSTKTSKQTQTTKSNQTSNPKHKKDESQTPTSSKFETPKATKKDPKKRKREEEEDIITVSDLELGEVVPEDDVETKALERTTTRYVSTLAVNVVWCEEVKFKELLDILEFQKWMDLFGKYAVEYFYPQAMEEFCDNFDYENGVVSSEVNQVKFSFDANVIAELFGVPNRGYDKFFKGKYKLKINGVDKDDILVSLNGEKGINNIDHNSLTPLNKLLFNLVRRSIIPRTQKRSEANLLDCAIIYCLANNIPVNFPSLMLSHMDHSIPSGNKVGYVTLMTRIFRHFKIPLDGYGRLGLKKEQFIQGSMLHGLNLGVMDGKMMLFTEILRLEEEQRVKEEEEEKKKMEEKKRGEEEEKMKMEDEKKTVRKSRRMAPKAKQNEEIPTVTLDEEDEAIEPPKAQSTEELLLLVLKELKALKGRQEETEGQIFLLRQSVSTIATTLEQKFGELLGCLKELNDAVGTSLHEAAGTSNVAEDVPTEQVPTGVNPDVPPS